MSTLLIAKQPFCFYSRLILQELTGLKAVNLSQLLKYIREVPDAVIYYHTHRFLQQHIYLNPEPPNDFAYWVDDVLGVHDLAENLASIDTIQFFDINSLRQKIIYTIEQYLKANPRSIKRKANISEVFHFIKAISFVFRTGFVAYNLEEFISILKIITIESIYFHIFESRLRLGNTKTNDFSYWLGTSVNELELAKRLAKLDPYTHTMEDLRKSIVRLAYAYTQT
ncbi:MAG: hypothetical protein DRP78_00110 [Candidatus Omnitrophota bacterium]|nr:MAG: hypothetical protein DRP78_00110 [Candidatus Omnitrophota bacterium]